MNDYKKWYIYRANLDTTIGSEQGKTRPVLVIGENAINKLLNCVNIVPITTRKEGRRIYPNEVLLSKGIANLENESIALCHQLRTIDKRRLSKLYGEITSDEVKKSIVDALKFQLGIS